MERSGGEEAADGDAAISPIHMQLVAIPGFSVALAVPLTSTIAHGRQVGHHVLQCHARGLAFEAGEFLGERCGGSLGATTAAFWVFHRFLARVDGTAVPGEVAHHAGLFVRLDKGGMDGKEEASGGKGSEGAGGQGFAGDVRGILPPTNATERSGCSEVIEKGASGREVIDRLEDEGSGDSDAILGRSTWGAEGRGRDVVFNADEFEDGDELALFGGEWTERFSEFGEESLLDSRPNG
jgi:hypothetical protein